MSRTPMHSNPLINQRRLLTKERHFMNVVHSYLKKSSLQGPPKLTAELIAVNLALIETIITMIELEVKRQGIADEELVIDLEYLNAGVEQRLRDLMLE